MTAYHIWVLSVPFGTLLEATTESITEMNTQLLGGTKKSVHSMWVNRVCAQYFAVMSQYCDVVTCSDRLIQLACYV